MSKPMSPGRKPTLKPLCVNLDEAIPFLRSVSYAIVAQRTTRATWVEDDTPVKYLYAAFLGAFGTPGTVQIQSASEARIREEVEVETHHRIDVLMNKAEHGPLAVGKYLADMDEIRSHSLKAIDELHADALAINRDIAKAWGSSVEFVSSVKLGATLTVKALGQIPGPGTAVSLVYDIAVGSIEELSQAGQAKGIVMVATENALTEGAKEVAADVAKGIVDKVNGKPTGKELTHALTRMRQLEEKLARQTDRLGARLAQRHAGATGAAVRDSINSLSRQIPRNAANLDAAQKSVVKAGAKAGLARAVGWVFLARDVLDAVAKHNATVAGARQ
jgi:hypothetical protein